MKAGDPVEVRLIIGHRGFTPIEHWSGGYEVIRVEGSQILLKELARGHQTRWNAYNVRVPQKK